MSDGNTLISLVLGTDRQAYGAVLAINAHEFGFNFVTNRQHQSGVFYAVTSSVGGTQVAFHAVSQLANFIGRSINSLTDGAITDQELLSRFTEIFLEAEPVNESPIILLN